MKPLYSNPENVTQGQLEPENGWRFLLDGEQPQEGADDVQDGHENWVIASSICAKGLSYRTRRQLPIEYCQGDNAEAFDDPAYKRSVEHYHKQGMAAEVAHMDDNALWLRHWWRPIILPAWHWDQGFVYRLAAEQPTRKEGDAEMNPGGTVPVDNKYLTCAANVQPEGRAVMDWSMDAAYEVIVWMTKIDPVRAVAFGFREYSLAHVLRKSFRKHFHSPTPIETAISRFSGKPFVEAE